MRLRNLREELAFAIAPWVYVPELEECEEAFKDLAEIAYLSRDAPWTSPRSLVKAAMEEVVQREFRLRRFGRL